MAYKKNIFKDKTVITLSTISIIAAAALIGGIALDSGSKSENKEPKNIVDLNEDLTTNSLADNDDWYSEEDENISATETTTEFTEKFAEEATTKPTEDQTTSDEISVNAPADSLNFTSGSILTWPVDGNIIIDYDMENTVYFPTLELYRCSDAICIQSDVGTPVYSSEKCVISEIGYNEEIGNYVIADLGNGYVLTYGQLSDISVNKDDIIEKNDLIGYISEPTDYYSVEGPNLYLKLTENGTPVNPLDHLNYE